MAQCVALALKVLTELAYGVDEKVKVCGNNEVQKLSVETASYLRSRAPLSITRDPCVMMG